MNKKIAPPTTKINLVIVFFLTIIFSATAIAQNNGRKPVKKENNLVARGIPNTGKYSKIIDSIKKSYNQEKLAELYTQFSEKTKLRKEEAIRYALLNKIPIRFEDDFGVLKELQLISKDGTPIYYITYNANAAISTRANYLNTGGGLGLNLNGDDLTAHVWDAGLARSAHQEYDGAGGANRFSIGDGTTALHYHSAHVVGTIMASGVQAASKGMAWQANAVGYDWNNDEAEAITAAANGMLVSNHSYGYDATAIPDSWFGQYGSDAHDWDAIMYNAPYYLMMVAAGNDGNDNSSNGVPLAGNSAYDKLNGHAVSKNNMVVANGQDANINGDGSLNAVNINSSSSEGPTDDYRIKPDITGNGTSLYSTLETANNAYANLTGTSMASPNVTGTLLILQEHYNNLNGSFMKAATLKGLALHTADDAGSSGPDAIYGWGLLNAKKAAETITTDAAGSGSAIINELSLSQGQTYQITVQSDGVNPLLASVSWTDPAGTINNGTNSSTPALVNDLDIRLNNGSNFTPWRLTGVTTNNTGDNTVDPFERIDINSASGTYTLTVTHKGTLSTTQNFSLIVTGIVVASSPVIGYASTSSNNTEDTDCNFTDINVPLNIAQAPSANADVNFTVNGSSTATSGLDFNLLTTSVTFPVGTTNPQNMILRIYHDGFVEGDETVIIDFTINANGGDATANTNANTFTLTINDDDAIPISTFTVDLLNEDFETIPSGWLIADRDGDTFNWIIGAAPGAHLSTDQLYSRSWDSTNGVLTPDNYIITSQIVIPSTLTSLNLTYQVAPGTITNSWYEEYYTVYWATDISSYATIDASPQVKPGAIIAQAIVNENIDMSAYLGQTGHLVFRHHNCTDEEYIAIDDMLLQGTLLTNIQTLVNTNTTNDQQLLTSPGTIYTADTVSDNLMLDISNNQSDDYGCVAVSVSRSGTSAQSYNGSVLPNLVMNKTFGVSSANNILPGDTSITFYFTETEIAGWEAATGLSRNVLVGAREVSGAITEVSNLTIGAFGTHVTLTGAFTGLEDTFYFGTTDAFGSCFGTVDAWNGAWSLGVPPTSANNVVFNANYTTSSGNIDAGCVEIKSGATLTIAANNYLKSNNNITIDSGSTLIIEHEGSLVQVDDDALVTNNGTINVVKTTTTFDDSTDFTIIGSPMTAETRDGVYDGSLVTMNHITSNFAPNAAVAAFDPAAENFADDNGDNWQFFTSSESIIPGVGYLVGGPPGGGNINSTYTQGTLNNGVITFPVIYNGTQNGSPNVLSNPYASAIDAVQLINNNALIDAIYFWEHLTTPGTDPNYPGQRAENYDMGDISMHNGTGGMAAANGGATPTQYIPSGQGFAIKANAAGNVTFNNTIRVTGNNTGYRTNTPIIEKLYLQVSNETYGLKSNALVGFTDLASNGYDAQYDAKRLATPISIYSIIEDKELSIQGRSVFNVDHIVPLGFRTLVEEEQVYRISISSLEGELITNSVIYLQDNLLNTTTNLSDMSYTFSSNISNQKDRFVLLFREEVLGATEYSVNTISLYPNPTNNILNIVSPEEDITNIIIYDITGRSVASFMIDNKKNYQLDVTSLKSAIYFVKISTQTGSITKRIIKN